MACKIDETKIQETIAFHGHSCPGLAIGIRAAELALSRLDFTPGANMVCVTETDMCGVDGIQFLTGCTFGKGNLIHKDYGKAGFTFFDRDNEKGFRALFQDDAIQAFEPANGDSERDARTRAIMEADLADLFSVAPVAVPPVRPARILESIICKECGEKVMESRIRRFAGQDLCIPCFSRHEQKI
ncbi:FmdE family protein [Desulfotignum phosphitoxidans]|uniref:Formylmethanofuran dehydrogenase subunit E n=1 Tax=Desulfotignum phosphitoxidans DSM 13687 TaxID=1286635 RepID=S0G3I9_9BACT|nr:FmdE family protein [Desulfotignum phosphitoxidans]EMS78767.1 formylmethanofuran dehydrogenase subunit E [Desulfotignum phosphitoxidans DSM 13687]MCF8076559.1 TraR/DksA C4-type zinc finger protein [Desulfotignum sp.]MCF8088325.1 TraR/DksA C4-type zinc finger protein [Desulfotignum sp.]MCF8137671.1 TraR/DksA C4-type zinc finger protein [Desulfotignum sp.]